MVVLIEKALSESSSPTVQVPDCCEREPEFKEVVVIGNGPSGIALSYLLAGNWPYYNGKGEDIHEMLHFRLMSNNFNNNSSLVEQDLNFLSQGLEGRTNNPVSLLFDALNHPQADLGQENPSLLEWNYRPERAINHVVIGKGPPGGSWQQMDGSVLTISLGCWMELPSSNFRKWAARHLINDSDISSSRCSVMSVAQYYKDYVAENKLGKYFLGNSVITSVVQLTSPANPPAQLHLVHENEKCLPKENCDINSNSNSTTSPSQNVGENENDLFDEDGSTIYKRRRHTISEIPYNSNSYRSICCSRYNSSRFSPSNNNKTLYKVKGFTMGEDPTSITPFTYITPNIVLATGSSDSPNILNVPGENLPFVLHSLSDLENLILSGSLNNNSDPVLVVGAGLSAADAIIASLGHNLKVIHIFRRSVDDPNLIFRQLPKNMYPEYHEVYQMMKDPCGNANYKAFEEHFIVEITADHRVRISGQDMCGALKVSNCIVCIGSHPDLSFMGDIQTNLGVHPSTTIDCKRNPIAIDYSTHESLKNPGIFALGPLVGENFVRFLQGGALAITNYLFKKRK